MQSLEVAVFEAKDPDGFTGRQAKVHAQLRDLFDGCVGSIGLRSLSEPEMFADLVVWESADAARARHDDHLPSADTVVSHLRLAPNANGVAGDVNGWTSPEAMQTMGPVMMQQTRLSPVFDERNEIVLFMPFTANVMP